MKTVFMTSFEAKPVLEEVLKSALIEKESYDSDLERKIESLKTSYIKLFGKEEFEKFLKANGLTK